MNQVIYTPEAQLRCVNFTLYITKVAGGELGYSGDASPHKSHQIPLDKTGSGSIMDPPARGATA